MAKEKNLDAGKQTDKPQEKFSNELMNDEELDQVAGGAGIAKMSNTSESESGVGVWKGFVTKEKSIVTKEKMLNTSESEIGVGVWKGFVTKEKSKSDFLMNLEGRCK